ncbi:sensor histidine kinase [Rhodococcus qingshengii]|uniref:sensor histidine kinase n=1 Tax=Rhodococcus qingshengii TaxID=334542 RepID=UPI0010A620ED|nr:ATP-binding protein [Rhodococcus qingshengii]THJ66368.1 hypothetical protein EU244_28085 [Rhodococcus qingshengii]
MRLFFSETFRLPIFSVLFADLSERGSTSTSAFSTAVETRSILQAFRQGALTFTALWQCVMVFATFGTLGRNGLMLAVAVALVGVIALLARSHRNLDPLISAGMVGTALWAYLASGDMDSALVFAACWQINFANCLAMILLLRPYGVPLTTAISVMLVAILALTLPEWGMETFFSILATQLSIIIGVRLGVSRLVGIASEADAIESRKNAALRRIQLVEGVSTEIAEESRMLHDTAINTLGAIADGSADLAGHRYIHEQCRRDVTMLRALRTRTARPIPGGLEEVFHHPGFTIRRSGVTDDEIAHCNQLVSASTISAVVYVVREAVKNSAKHSGADHARIQVRISATHLTVDISDSGQGFDPRTPTDGRGIAESIIGRARDNGFHAAVDSRPGVGTLVTVTVPLDQTSTGSGHPEVAEGVEDAPWTSTVHLYERTSELWAIGATAVSVILTAAGGTNNHMALFPMIALMAAACLVYHFVPGFRGHRLAGLVLATISSAVFVLSAAAVEFGSDGVFHWQALAATGPFVLLLSVTTKRSTRALAAALWTVAVLATAVVGLSYSGTAAQIVLVAGAVGIGFCGLWATLQHLLATFGREAVRSEREVHEVLLQAEVEEAAQKSSQRWMDAGLESAINLLDEIGRSARDPASQSTRRACGAEERYLRQLIQISPNLVNLSRAFPATLARARDLGVSFFLQLGDVDIREDETAQSISTYILGILTKLNPGDELRVSLFPVGDALQLTLVGESIASPDFPFARVTHAHLGAVDLIEMTLI